MTMPVDPYLVRKHQTQVNAMLTKLALGPKTPLVVRFATYHDAAHNPWVILVEQADVDMARRLWDNKPDTHGIGPFNDRVVAVIAPALT